MILARHFCLVSFFRYPIAEHINGPQDAHQKQYLHCIRQLYQAVQLQASIVRTASLQQSAGCSATSDLSQKIEHCHLTREMYGEIDFQKIKQILNAKAMRLRTYLGGPQNTAWCCCKPGTCMQLGILGTLHVLDAPIHWYTTRNLLTLECKPAPS